MKPAKQNTMVYPETAEQLIPGCFELPNLAGTSEADVRQLIVDAIVARAEKV